MLILKRALRATAVLGSALAAAVAVPGTAQAYGSSVVVGFYGDNHEGYQWTSVCKCVWEDPFDNTYFQKDDGGKGFKIPVWDTKKPAPSNYLGKVEFHPYGEKLWLYDTANDGDTYYARINFTRNGKWQRAQTLHPPGTGSKVDKRVFDFDIPEGEKFTLRLYDDSGLKDRMTSTSWTGIT
ncbi:hypothetical protein ACX6XY_14650 [Streptomyces sp. O3]